MPLPPYKIQPLDVLAVTVANTLENEPIAGLFPVDPDGTISLGGRHKSVKVVGMTTAEAKAAIQKHLDTILKDPKVINVTQAFFRALRDTQDYEAAWTSSLAKLDWDIVDQAFWAKWK